MLAKLSAEFFGTFWLVLGGCGSAVIAATFPEVGIGYLGVSFAFGLAVLTAAYALGPISGGHFNPAVSVGLWGRRAFSCHTAFALCLCPSAWRYCGRSHGLPNRERKCRFQSCGWPGFQWLCRPFSWRIHLNGWADNRDSDDIRVSYSHSRCHPPACTGGICWSDHRTCPCLDSSD